MAGAIAAEPAAASIPAAARAPGPAAAEQAAPGANQVNSQPQPDTHATTLPMSMQQARVEVVQESSECWIVELELDERLDPEQQPEQREWRIGPFPSKDAAANAARLLRRKLHADGGCISPTEQQQHHQPGGLLDGEEPEGYTTAEVEEDLEDLQQCTLAELVELLQEHVVEPESGGDGGGAAPPVSANATGTPAAPCTPGGVPAAEAAADGANRIIGQSQQPEQHLKATGPSRGRTATEESDGGVQGHAEAAFQQQQPAATAAPAAATGSSLEALSCVYELRSGRYRAKVGMAGKRVSVNCDSREEAAVARDLCVLWRRVNEVEAAGGHAVDLFYPQYR